VLSACWGTARSSASRYTAFPTELQELLQILTVASTVQFGLDRKSDGAGSLVNDHDCRDHSFGVRRRNPLRTVGRLGHRQDLVTLVKGGVCPKCSYPS